MKQTSIRDYFIIQESAAPLEIVDNHFEILSENKTVVNGIECFTLTFNTVLQSAGVRNFNNRIYQTTDTIMNGAKRNPVLMHNYSEGLLAGEYDHPESGDTKDSLKRQFIIMAKNVSHYIDKFWAESNLIMGTITTAPDGYGLSMAKRAAVGRRPQFSTRGIGSGRGDGTVDDATYMVITWDGVQNPSHKEAVADPKSYKFKNTPVPISESYDGKLIRLSESTVNTTLSNLFEDKEKAQLENFCEAFGFEYDTMRSDGKNILVTRYKGDLVETAVIPHSSVVMRNMKQIFLMK